MRLTEHMGASKPVLNGWKLLEMDAVSLDQICYYGALTY